jgi:hypothetical protein
MHADIFSEDEKSFQGALNVGRFDNCELIVETCAEDTEPLYIHALSMNTYIINNNYGRMMFPVKMLCPREEWSCIHKLIKDADKKICRLTGEEICVEGLYKSCYKCSANFEYISIKEHLGKTDDKVCPSCKAKWVESYVYYKNSPSIY